MSGLQLPLRIAGAYLFVIGIIMLFPRLTMVVFGTAEVADPPLLLVYAGVQLGLGYLIWRLGSDPRFHDLAPAVVLLLVLHVASFVVNYARGEWSLRTVLVPILINGALAIWIWSARRAPA